MVAQWQEWSCSLKLLAGVERTVKDRHGTNDLIVSAVLYDDVIGDSAEAFNSETMYQNSMPVTGDLGGSVDLLILAFDLSCDSPAA